MSQVADGGAPARGAAWKIVLSVVVVTGASQLMPSALAGGIGPGVGLCCGTKPLGSCSCGSPPPWRTASCAGPNDDTIYGGCTTQCTWGTYCGDGIVNGPEECDNGKDNGATYGTSGCTIGCTRPHSCGDGVVDTDRAEECDLGSENGGPLCSSDCRLPVR